MKKGMLLCALVVLSCLSASAIYFDDDGIPEGYRGFADFSYTLGVGDWGKSHDRIGIMASHGYQIAPQFFAGLGVGFNYYFDGNDELCSLPLFAHFRSDLINNEITPYVDLRVGYSLIDVKQLFPAGCTDKRFTFEYTNNPAWLMVEALHEYAHPYDDCAICQAMALFSQDIATSLGSHEEINAAIQRWNEEQDSVTALSPLERNDEVKNNLMTSDFMTEFLVKLYNSEDFEVIEQCIPTPGEGTLKNRMLYFKDNMRAKTGTLSDTSAITGYITTRRGKVYVFNIMIQDAKTSEADKKNIEEQILRQVYMMN